MTTFRRAFYKMLPAWATRGQGELVHWALCRMLDAYDAKIRAGLEARFPSLAGPSALALIGKDRGIIRGRSENDDHYVGRLQRWRWPRGHRTRGSAFALLEQIVEYWGSAISQAATFDVNRNAHSRLPDGTESFFYGATWDWDGDTSRRARFWTYIAARAGGGITAWGTWAEFAAEAGPTWADAKASGLTWAARGVYQRDVAAMQSLVQGRFQWKPAGTYDDYMILALETTVLAPAGTWGTYYGRQTRPATIRFLRIGRDKGTT